MSTPPSSPSSSSNNGGPVAAIVTPIVVGVVVVSVAYLIIRCKLVKMRIRSSIPTHNAAAREEELSATVRATRSTSSTSMAMDSRIGIEPVEQFLKDILREKPMRFTPEDLANFTQNYGQVLGSGGFGVVYKGQFLNGLPMAVKVLKPIMNKRAEEQFMAEVGTIGRTYHINLVKLYGFCFDKSVKALVYEYMENGSLDQYLFGERSHEIEWGKLYEIAIATGKGIRYLHEECQQKIVHYDIKPANVLLTSNFTPKVADFGLAKFCDPDRSFATFTGARGTPGYAAPELWMPISVTHKCDVYSFGMLLFEILGRRRNLDLMSVEEDQSQVMDWFPKWVWERFEKGDMRSIVEDCGIDEKYSEKAARACQVALWCVQYQADARPSMGRVVKMLEGEEIMPPGNPFQYMAPFSSSSSAASWTTRTSSAPTDSSGQGRGNIDSGAGMSGGEGSGGTGEAAAAAATAAAATDIAATANAAQVPASPSPPPLPPLPGFWPSSPRHFLRPPHFPGAPRFPTSHAGTPCPRPAAAFASRFPAAALASRFPAPDFPNTTILTADPQPQPPTSFFASRQCPWNRHG